MSHRSLVLLLTILFAMASSAAAQQPPRPSFRFQKTNSVLLDVGPQGSFDACQAKYPSVMKVGGRWWMWYNGRTDDCFTGSIGLATSDDGLHWTKENGGQPIFRHGTAGTLDSTKIDHPAVLRFGGKFHMWYTAGGDRSQYKIGYATSPDGMDWTREHGSQPVLGPGEPGKFDAQVVLHPAVVRDDTGLLHLWYNGVGAQPGFRVGHATSRDGVHWQRQNHGDPVLVPSQVGSFQEAYVYNVHVRLERGTYHMWYSAAQSEYGAGGHSCLTYASSQDGTHWRKDAVPTLISGPPGSIDEYATFACCVVSRDDGLWMYYSAADKQQTYRVSLARMVK